MLNVLISKNRVRGRSGCLAPTNQPGLPINAKAHGDPLIARGPEQSSLSNPYKIYFLFFLKQKMDFFGEIYPKSGILRAAHAPPPRAVVQRHSYRGPRCGHFDSVTQKVRITMLALWEYSYCSTPYLKALLQVYILKHPFPCFRIQPLSIPCIAIGAFNFMDGTP